MPPDHHVEVEEIQDASEVTTRWYNEVIDNLIGWPARVREKVLEASQGNKYVRRWMSVVAGLWGLGKAAFIVFVISYTLLLTVVAFPVFILSIVLVGNIDWMDPKNKPQHDDEQQAAAAAADEEEELEKPISKRLLLPGMVKAARVGVLVLVLLLPITLSVSRLREEARPLGSPLWHWWLLAAAISLFTPIIILFAYFLTEILRKDIEQSKNVYAIRGAENSVRRVLYFALILLIWVAYFTVDQREIRKAYKRVHTYIILTLVALLIWAILGFLKDIAVLWWQSEFIYTTPKRKEIIFYACELFFYSPNGENENEGKNERGMVKPKPIGQQKIVDVFTLQDIDEVARWLKRCIPDEIPYIHTSEWKARRRLILPEFRLSLSDFSEKIEKLSPKEDPYAELKSQKEARLERSLAFASKIYEEFKLKGILSTMLTIVQVAVAFLVWLFITGLATTKLVLALGSLFVGLTFVFSDTCKTFFQSCIFSFVTHPLDIGDRVLIDPDQSTQLEVRRINVMITRFVETNNPGKIIIYPNSDLATKKITKLVTNVMQVMEGSNPESESKN